MEGVGVRTGQWGILTLLWRMVGFQRRAEVEWKAVRNRVSSRNGLEKTWSPTWKNKTLGTTGMKGWCRWVSSKAERYEGRKATHHSELSASTGGCTNYPQDQHFSNCMSSDFIKYLKKSFLINHIWAYAVIKEVSLLQEFLCKDCIIIMCFRFFPKEGDAVGGISQTCRQMLHWTTLRELTAGSGCLWAGEWVF